MLNYCTKILRFFKEPKTEMKENQILKLNRTPTGVKVLRRGMSGMVDTVSASYWKKDALKP